MSRQVSPEGWDLPQEWNQYDVSLGAVILRRVAVSLPWLEPEECLGVAERATASIGRLAAAWESGFIASVDATFNTSGYAWSISLPDMSMHQDKEWHE